MEHWARKTRAMVVGVETWGRCIEIASKNEVN